MHWVVHFDPRGEHSLRYRCKNVNLVEKTVKGVEDELEFLFVPCVLCRLCVCRAWRQPADANTAPSSFQILRFHRLVSAPSRQDHGR